MGNQQGSMMEGVPQPPVPPESSSSAAVARSGEPLESFAREKQRDDHLKNLGFKRNKSLRKSISKRLRRKKKTPPQDVPDGDSGDQRNGARRASADDAASSANVERLDRTAEAAEAKRARKRPLVGDQPQPFPTHVQQVEKIRRKKRGRLYGE